MSIKELYEKLKAVQENKEVKQKELDGLNVKTKTATDEELADLKTKIEELGDTVEALIGEEEEVQNQIEEADEQLKSLAKKESEKRQKEKGSAKMTDYLKTKESAVEYARMLVDNQGKSNKDMQGEWEAHVKSTGVTGLDN